MLYLVCLLLSFFFVTMFDFFLSLAASSTLSPAVQEHSEQQHLIRNEEFLRKLALIWLHLRHLHTFHLFISRKGQKEVFRREQGLLGF